MRTRCWAVSPSDVDFRLCSHMDGRRGGVAACGNLIAPDVDSLANDIELVRPP